MPAGTNLLQGHVSPESSGNRIKVTTNQTRPRCWFQPTLDIMKMDHKDRGMPIVNTTRPKPRVKSRVYFLNSTWKTSRLLLLLLLNGRSKVVRQRAAAAAAGTIIEANCNRKQKRKHFGEHNGGDLCPSLMLLPHTRTRLDQCSRPLKRRKWALLVVQSKPSSCMHVVHLTDMPRSRTVSTALNYHAWRGVVYFDILSIARAGIEWIRRP